MSKKYSANFEDRNIDQEDLAYRQALQYGLDMAAVYKQERQKREALEIAYKKLELVFDSISDGFVVVDKALGIIEMNQAAVDLFERTAADAEGCALTEILQGEAARSFCRRLSGGQPQKISTRVEITAPWPRTVDIQAAPLPDGGWVLIIHDITWEERVNNMREEFLHLASHELRTPLAGVIGFTSLLGQIANETTFPEDVRPVLGNILKSSEKLRSAIDDLVNATINDTAEAEIDAIDLRYVVQDALALLSNRQAQHEVSLQINLPKAEMLVFGNKKMLATAVGHLIENGIQYNKPGGRLTITGKIKAKTFSLIFADTGRGIARKDLNYITQPFFQVEKHSTRHAIGMGLGLSIVKRALALHKGDLRVDSEVGKGSVFTFTVPRFTVQDLPAARREWLQLQERFTQQEELRRQEEDTQTEAIIEQLQRQLEVTQSQNIAYAKDLAKLYQIQRTDAHELQVKQAQISHADRLALMGQLAAGVAHDLSNLISPILGYSQIILRRKDTIDPTMVDIIERILGMSRRANALLRQMVTLSKSAPEKFEYFDLAPHLKDIVQILEIRLRHANIDLIEGYDPNVPEVYGSPVQISQVVLNLVVNAIDSMNAGGVLTARPRRAAETGPIFCNCKFLIPAAALRRNTCRIFLTLFTPPSRKYRARGWGYR